MMNIRVGTAGWNYPSGKGTWNGVFYPARRPRGFDELRYYAEHFDIVEVNSTFYRMPDAGIGSAYGHAWSWPALVAAVLITRALVRSAHSEKDAAAGGTTSHG